MATHCLKHKDYLCKGKYYLFIDKDYVQKKRLGKEKNYCPYKGLCIEIFFSKNLSLLWKWVVRSRSHSEFFVFGKSSKNGSKPVLILWSSIPCAFCLCIHC